MISAIDVIAGAVANTDRALMKLHGTSRSILKYIYGSSSYIENEIMLMSESKKDPYPVVALFTEGVTETTQGVFTDVSIQKIVIAIPTAKPSASNEYKHVESFKKRLYEIMEEFEKSLRGIHFGYDLQVSRTDVTSYRNRDKSAGLNDICDGIIVKGLKLKIYNQTEC